MQPADERLGLLFLLGNFSDSLVVFNFVLDLLEFSCVLCLSLQSLLFELEVSLYPALKCLLLLDALSTCFL